MRILFITAAYPPDVTGGWDLLVEALDVRLRSRGHETRVLTGASPEPIRNDSVHVHRTLTQEGPRNYYRPSSIFGYASTVRDNLEACRLCIEDFRPDVVFVHSMWNMSRGIAWQAERLCPRRVVYYMSDHWLLIQDPHESYWADPPRTAFRRAAKRLIGPFALAWIRHHNRKFDLALDRVLCVSRAIQSEVEREVGLAPENLRVVYNGVDVDRFQPALSRQSPPDAFSLVYCGGLLDHKGVDTAIEALKILKSRGKLENLTLTIAGDGHPDCRESLRAQVSQARLGDHIFFVGWISRSDMPRFLQRFDAMVFPSRWEEPLALTVQEAMASGLPVIGTLTGGTGELLVDGQTGFTFDPGNAEQLATCVERVRTAPQELQRVALAARQEVLKRFNIERTVDEVEECLAACMFESRQPVTARVFLPAGKHRAVSVTP